MNKFRWMAALLTGMFSLPGVCSSQVSLSFTAEVEPPPCHIIQIPATLDFGNINRNQLSAKAPTQLAVKSFTGAITIQCEAPTSIGLSAVDNSGGHALETGSLQWTSPNVTLMPAQTDQRFGLGMTPAGSAIGVWNVVFHSAQVDGAPAQIGIANNGALDLNDTVPTMRNNGRVNCWVQNNRFATGSLFTVQADAAVSIAPTQELASGSKINFAGSVTLEVVYL